MQAFDPPDFSTQIMNLLFSLEDRAEIVDKDDKGQTNQPECKGQETAQRTAPGISFAYDDKCIRFSAGSDCAGRKYRWMCLILEIGTATSGNDQEAQWSC